MPNAMHRLLVAAFSLLATLAILPAQAQEKRVALVIGMGEYQHLASLNDPVPDAKAVAASLKAHGIQVSEHYNLPRADLLDVLEKFKREAACGASNPHAFAVWLTPCFCLTS